MPRTKAQAPEPRSKQRAQEDITQHLEDAVAEARRENWKEAYTFAQDALLLTKALITLPARVRTIKSIPEHNNRYSRSLEKGLMILGLFTPERPVIGIADAADALEISRSTTHRYMISLVQLGQLEQVSGRKYRRVVAS